MMNSIANSIQKPKGKDGEFRKSLFDKVGVTGFEPATSWSRTKNTPSRKSSDNNHFAAQFVSPKSDTSHSHDTGDTSEFTLGTADSSLNSIAGCYSPRSSLPSPAPTEVRA
jgi:hypothetical protein